MTGQAIESCRTIKTLNVGKNNIREYGILRLSMNLRYNASLTDLRLNHNNLGPEGGRSVGKVPRFMSVSLFSSTCAILYACIKYLLYCQFSFS